VKNVFVNQAPMEVEHTWVHGEHVIFKFKGVDSISDAERLAGAQVSIPIEDRPAAEEGEFYRSDLVGCEMFEQSGRLLGVVEEWQETGGAPLVVVRSAGGKELLIPFAGAIFSRIDVATRRIDVNLPEGLEDLN
jgi:16S rRNA processing protein RimM